MTEPVAASLRGRRILVVEDEYFLAEEVARALEEAGAVVLGPVPTVAEAGGLAVQPVDGAVLDVNLGGEMVWPVADALLARGTAVVLATGYDAATIPARYAPVPRCEKPVATRDLLRVLAEQFAAPA